MCVCVCVCVCVHLWKERESNHEQTVCGASGSNLRENELGGLFRSVTSSMPGKLNFISNYWYLGVQLWYKNVSGDGGGGVMVQECQWKVMTGEGGQFSEASCYVTNIIVVLCFFGIVWRFRILWEGSFSLWHHPCRVSWIPRVCLYCFSFSNYTFSIQRWLFLSWTVWSIHTRGSYSGRLVLGSPLEFWELNRNKHLGSIYF